MSDRLTAAGAALVNDPEAGHEETCDTWRQRGCDCGFRYAVAAIENEAAARAVDEALSVERVTAAGEALLRRLTTRGTQDNRPFEAAIRAIEAEAAARAVDEALSVERVARALHEWRISSDSVSQCGWLFASSTEATGPLCPCPADAAALVAHLRGEK